GEMTDEAGTDLLKLAFELVAERGWRGFSLLELARRAEVPLATVYAVLPSDMALLRTLGRRLDSETFAMPMAELDRMSPRERVFELIMRRLDAMAPFKPGLVRMTKEAGCRPELVAAGCCNLRRLSRRLLDVSRSEDQPVIACIARRVIG